MIKITIERPSKTKIECRARRRINVINLIIDTSSKRNSESP